MTNDDKTIREMAREICAKRFDERGWHIDAKEIRRGELDDYNEVIIAEAAIRAGINLGRSL